MSGVPRRKGKPITAVGKAFPILTDPFPLQIHHATVAKPIEGGPMGIKLTEQPHSSQDPNGVCREVRIKSLKLDSPLQSTSIRPGQRLLVVQGQAAVSSSQCVSLIRAAQHEVTFTTVDAVTARYCHVVAAPPSLVNPGVNFASVCGRSLVQISHVYRNGPFVGRGLCLGDIVLSVDGVPVATPEAADQALRKARHKPVVVLYVVSIHALRRAITKQALEILQSRAPGSGSNNNSLRGGSPLEAAPAWNGVTLRKDEDSSVHDAFCIHIASQNGNNNKHHRTTSQKPLVARGMYFDPDTLHMKDGQAHTRLVAQSEMDQNRNSEWHVGHNHAWKNPKLFFKGRYRTMVLPFMDEFNQILEDHLVELKEAVGCAAWQHDEKDSESEEGEPERQQSPGFAQRLSFEQQQCQYPQRTSTGASPSAATAPPEADLIPMAMAYVQEDDISA